MIALNPADQQPKIRIYREEMNPEEAKGDGLVCYNAEESVKLALDILDGGYIRPNFKITVTKATFDHHDHQQTKTAINQNRHISQAQIKVARNAMKQALAWNEDDDMGISKSSALKIVVLEGMFTLDYFKSANKKGTNAESEEDRLVQELEEDVAEEVSKIGEIEKITIFTKNPNGIIVIRFTTSFAAQECIRLMNGRYFSGRKIKCFFWDGVTNYAMVSKHLASVLNDEEEDEEEKEEKDRLDEFGDWLDKDQEELPEEFRLKAEG